MKELTIPQTQKSKSRGWVGAYFAFLRSRHENLVLKAAPLLLLFGSPELILSNLLPIAGEALDIGGFGLAVLVIVRTVLAVRKYR